MPQFSNVAAVLSEEMNDPEPTEEESKFIWIPYPPPPPSFSNITSPSPPSRFLYNLEQKKFYDDNIDKIIKCQSLIRMQKNRRDYVAQKNYWGDNLQQVVLAQALYRGLVARRAYNEKIMRFRNAAGLIIRVSKGVWSRWSEWSQKKVAHSHLFLSFKRNSEA